jgi:dolichol-phosphate mannosyltransferase
MALNHLLAIPVYNEEAHIARVLREARRFSRDILVVDDGSTDRTPHLLREHPTVRVISHPENRGYGKSIADAFAFAQRSQFDWLITMDCDGQHEASHIPRFLAEAARGDADIVSGTRYPHGYDVDASVPPDRREINQYITGVLNRRLGLDLTDAFCGFKAYRVSALRDVRITVPGYAMPMQLWVQAARAGLQIRELPVRLIYNDPTRHFGGILDDPAVRLRHYLDVLESELPAGHVVDDRLPAGRRVACGSSPDPCSISRS